MVESGVLETSADDLLRLVKEVNKIAVDEAAKKLKVPVKTLQAIVDFLVEEKILGIEYKFTTPYIYLQNEESAAEIPSKAADSRGTVSGISLKSMKDDFFRKAAERGIAKDDILLLWKKYLKININFIRQHFYEVCSRRGISKIQIDGLWERYQKENLR